MYATAAAAKSLQSCPTLCDLMDQSSPGSSVHGILQVRILEWVVISFSRGSPWPRDRIRSPALQADSLPAEIPGKPKTTGVGCHFLLKGIFPNPRVPLTISSFAAPFSSGLQSFPASRSFPVTRLFTPGSLTIVDSVSVPVLPMNIDGWFPLGLTGLIFLQFKGLSRVFSSPIIQKRQFFSAQPSLSSNSHIRTWLMEKP